MRQNFDELPNGYLESINNGIKTVRTFKGNAQAGKGTREEQLKRLKEEIQTADAIVIGGGAGLSTSAGLTYSGERFERYFGDFAAKFGIQDMYSGDPLGVVVQAHLCEPLRISSKACLSDAP